MAVRSASPLLALALLAVGTYFVLPTPGSNPFVAPQTTVSSRVASGEPSVLAQTVRSSARSTYTSAAAQPGPPADNGQPGKINLLFLGLLTGTAVIGLIALFAYGAYSGSGSSL
mmetsp:Transcript_23223/g.52846  ORF Transcript_23223/g.52846 Transcript_23223/m.52846 type:complete len:114 (-) Transcript_23223:143-484(-)